MPDSVSQTSPWKLVILVAVVVVAVVVAMVVMAVMFMMMVVVPFTTTTGSAFQFLFVQFDAFGLVLLVYVVVAIRRDEGAKEVFHVESFPFIFYLCFGLRLINR
jgi:uncharacterized membrane protein